MAVARTGVGQNRLLPNGLETALKRLLGQFFGLTLIIAAGAGWLCLLSWSIDDPSLNHATSEAPRNLLGPLGASLSDLMFQLAGLGAIAIFLPPAAWGWLLLNGHAHRRPRLRFLSWPLSVLAIASALSALSPPTGWPLPIGLGGMAGDALLSFLARNINHFVSPWGTVLAGSALTVIGITCLVSASGISLKGVAGLWRFDSDETGWRVRQAIAAFLYGLLRIRIGILDKARSSPTHFRLRNVLADLAVLDRQPIINAKPPIPNTPLRQSKLDPLGRIEPYFDGLDGQQHFAGGGPIGASDSIDPGALLSEFGPIGGPEIPNPPEPPEVPARSAHGRQRTRTNKRYKPPHLRLLKKTVRAARGNEHTPEVLQENALALESVLQDFGVSGEISKIRSGPVVTLYELEPARGTKSARVTGLADDIARSMSSVSARVAIIPGRNAIGIELPNETRETVYLRELIESSQFAQTEVQLALALGKTIDGDPVIVDLARMPHLLVAGTTGSGKSVGINTMILSLLFRLSPDECKFIMIDPKMLELSVYDGIPHLLTPVVTEPKKAIAALKWTVREMEERYKHMSKLGVRNIEGYNKRIREAEKKGEVLSRTVQTGFDNETGQAVYEREHLDLDPLPFIVVVIDEMADLMMVAGKDIEAAVQRLAQMARAAGIHLITATQRPSVDVITGTIKANFPTRISFQVTSKIDSRTILGEQGAEQLLGAGDMLYLGGGGRPARIHGPFVSDEEIERIAKFLKAQGEPHYVNEVTESPDNGDDGDGPSGSSRSTGDDLYDRAVEIVLRDKRVSTSYIQRKLSIGYNRAATLVERMEEDGLISAADRVGRRSVLIDRTDDSLMD